MIIEPNAFALMVKIYAVWLLLKCIKTVLLVVLPLLCLQPPHRALCVNCRSATTAFTRTPYSCIIWNILNGPVLCKSAGKQVQNPIKVIFRLGNIWDFWFNQNTVTTLHHNRVVDVVMVIATGENESSSTMKKTRARSLQTTTSSSSSFCSNTPTVVLLPGLFSEIRWNAGIRRITWKWNVPLVAVHV